jgi:hypothetical protein
MLNLLDFKILLLSLKNSLLKTTPLFKLPIIELSHFKIIILLIIKHLNGVESSLLTLFPLKMTKSDILETLEKLGMKLLKLFLS